MTGFSYEACRNLYFVERVPEPPRPAKPEDWDKFVKYREDLLRWISTYVNLVSEWCAVGVDKVSDDLEKMAKDVAPSSDGRHRADGAPSKAPTSAAPPGLERESFDADFDEVLGAVRAKVPYAYYAVLFGQYCSRLRHPRKDHDPLSKADDRRTIANDLLGCLAQMAHVLPDGAYEVIEHDLNMYTNPGLENLIEPTNPKQDIQTWSDLIFGVVTPREILNQFGNSLLYGSVVLLGLGLSLIVVLVVSVVFMGVTNIPGINLSNLSLQTGQDFISSVQTVITTLAAVGLSLSLLVTRAWALLQSFEGAAIIFLAKRPRLRRRMDSPNGQ